MASFTSSAGRKRVRPWDSCQDVEKLKEMLEDREAEIESFRKQSALEAEGTVKKLRETLQERDAHIEQLMREVENSRATSAFGKIFAATSNVAPKNVSLKMMKCGSEDCHVKAESISVEARKGVVRRCASLPKSKSVATDSEEDIDCDKGLTSDSNDDEDYTGKEMSADSTDDEEYTTAFIKKVSASHGKAKKPNTKGHACIGEEGNIGNILSLRASIQKQIVSQMIYRPGLKYRSSKAVAEVPNLSEAHIKAILGDDLFAKASHTGKLIQVTASDDDIKTLFHGPFTKRLRYGAVLTLCDGLKFAFTKATGVLKVTGVFSM